MGNKCGPTLTLAIDRFSIESKVNDVNQFKIISTSSHGFLICFYQINEIENNTFFLHYKQQKPALTFSNLSSDKYKKYQTIKNNFFELVNNNLFLNI